MSLVEYLNLFKDFILVIKENGVYAGCAIFIILWFMERRKNEKIRAEFTNMLKGLISNNTETERTLGTWGEAFSNMANKIEENKKSIVSSIQELEKVLSSILLIKRATIKDGNVIFTAIPNDNKIEISKAKEDKDV